MPLGAFSWGLKPGTVAPEFALLGSGVGEPKQVHLRDEVVVFRGRSGRGGCDDLRLVGHTSIY